MGGLSQPSPLAEQRESHLVPILLGVAFVLIVVGVIAVLSRSSPKPITPPNPYAAKVNLSDLKMSVAENFVGARITYIEGTVTNRGQGGHACGCPRCLQEFSWRSRAGG